MAIVDADLEPVEGSDDALNDTSNDTQTDNGHTSNSSVDVDGLLKQLDSVKDTIPPEKLAFLDPKFQPAFNRRVNLLNKAVDDAVKGTFGEEFKLPEGKTGLDMLTENGGKGFAEMLRSTIQREVGPVRQQIDQANHEKTLAQHMQLAAQDNPMVREHFQRAIAEIENDPNLVALAEQGGGKGIYYVLQGVAANIAARDGIRSRDARIKELESVLTKHNIAVKAAGGTSKAGGSKKPDSQAPAKTLKEALSRAAAKVSEQDDA